MLENLRLRGENNRRGGGGGGGVATLGVFKGLGVAAGAIFFLLFSSPFGCLMRYREDEWAGCG